MPSQDQVSVGEGTSAFFWDGTSYDVVEYKEPNVFQSELNVTADTTLEVHAGVTNEIYVLKGGAHTLTKTGPGVLKIVQVETTDLTLDIQCGEVLFDDPSVPGNIFLDAALWLDADNEATRMTETETGRTLVTRWNDVNGGAIYATAGTVAPYLTNDNGRTYVDFGTLRTSSGEGYGGRMTLSAALTGFREVLAVVRPSDDVYALSSGGIAPVGSSSSWTAFMPGSNTSGNWPPIINVYQGVTKQLRDGIYVDGVKGSTAGDGQRWLSGVHVYDFRLDEPENVELASDEAEVNAVGNERRNAYGGFRLGELVVYPAQLNAAERTRRQLTLMAKWLGAAGCTQRVESISVAAGAAVSMPYVNVEVDGVLALAGAFEAQSVKASVIAPLSTSAAVAGILDLTEPGVVRIDQSLYGDAINEGYVRIVAAPSVVGSVRLWRVENLAGGLLKLRAGADGLYATGKVSGLGIIFR